jgi:hypothetical protein
MMSKIEVSETEDLLRIDVTIGEDIFGASVLKGKIAIQPVIDNLMDQITKECIGLTSHDISMAIANHYLKEGNRD